MTEQEILETIRNMRDSHAIVTRIRQVNLMFDYVQQLEDGDRLVPADWINSFPALFPEDFEDKMNQLQDTMASIDGLLEQLARIKTVLEQRLHELHGVG